MDQAGLLSGIGEDRLADVESVLEQFFASSLERAVEHGAGFVRLWTAIESATEGYRQERVDGSGVS